MAGASEKQPDLLLKADSSRQRCGRAGCAGSSAQPPPRGHPREPGRGSRLPSRPRPRPHRVRAGGGSWLGQASFALLSWGHRDHRGRGGLKVSLGLGQSPKGASWEGGGDGGLPPEGGRAASSAHRSTPHPCGAHGQASERGPCPFLQAIAAPGAGLAHGGQRPVDTAEWMWQQGASWLLPAEEKAAEPLGAVGEVESGPTPPVRPPQPLLLKPAL